MCYWFKIKSSIPTIIDDSVNLLLVYLIFVIKIAKPSYSEITNNK